MADCGNLPSWLNTVPWLLVVTGWAIVNHQNNYREKRKEIRGKINGVKEFLFDLEDAAIHHHTTEQTPPNCMKIKRIIARVSAELKALEVIGLKIEAVDIQITRIRQSITLKNFESKRYSPLDSGNSILADIGASTDKLGHSLEMAYAAKFLV